jgi:hypothetical protein
MAVDIQIMKVVLLGSIPKGDSTRKDWTDWKLPYVHAIRTAVPNVTFTHGDAISDNAGPQMVVGHDLAQIKRADVCVVDAQAKIGAGTAQEMVIAKYFKKPLVVVIPKGTHHRKSDVTFHGVTIEDWVHPFLYISSDYVAESIEDAANWLKEYAKSPADYPIKDLSVFEEAIEHFEANAG